MALTDKLTAIGNAIREKTGGTDLLTLDQMPTEISNIQGGGTVEELTITSNGTYNPPTGIDGYAPVVVNVPQDGSPPAEAFVISGDCSYRFAKDGWNWFIEKYGDRITTKDIIDASRMFSDTNVITKVPFDLNFGSGSIYSLLGIFSGCHKITQVPKLNNVKAYNTSYMFYSCDNLRTIPEDIADTWDWSYLESQTTPYDGNQGSMFYYCYSLRSIPMNLIKSGNPYLKNSNSYYYYGFNNCYALDEVINLPIPYTKATWTSNVFSYTFGECSRLKNMTFRKNEDGSPVVVNWKSQTIDLTNYVGYAFNASNITGYNSGITADKQVSDDTTYQALKDDPDWFSTDINYSRYNHDSAVRTINSLPDTSAYLATAGGTNTIKFKGASGSKTDGGAINTLTEEEIAVATAKGWTVSLV